MAEQNAHPSKLQLQRNARKSKREYVDDKVSRLELNFTYIRPRDLDGEPMRHGGAVVCWQQPDRLNTRVLPVSIAWCHDDDAFDKLEGRYRAAYQFANGNYTNFRLPAGKGHISARLIEVFTNGFFEL